VWVGKSLLTQTVWKADSGCIALLISQSAPRIHTRLIKGNTMTGPLCWVGQSMFGDSFLCVGLDKCPNCP
jgi:hypothetical protein